MQGNILVMANSILSKHVLQNEAAAIAWVEVARMAGRASLPALRGRRAHRQDEGQSDPHWALEVLPVPQTVHREGRDRL